MAKRPSIRLPRHWPGHVKSGILHAISLASVALVAAQGRAAATRRLRVRLDRADHEIAMLREELAIKDARWQRSHSRRRPHYLPVQRMRILQLRAARGWTLEHTAHVFLLDLQTLHLWMRRLDEEGEHALIQAAEPVNRYPDFVRVLVTQLKRVLPRMGNKRLAQIFARAGLRMSPTTIRRFLRKPRPPRPEPTTARQRKKVVARHPGHTWHVDLTAVPTRAGFAVSWFPFSLPQQWPFCWWVAVAMDQWSRVIVGVEVFRKTPDSSQMQRFLDAAIGRAGKSPQYIVTDKGRQFWCRGYKRWCKRHRIRPRYGALGQPASIPLVERLIRSMKQECTRLVMVSLVLGEMRRELQLYAAWFNEHRPHQGLDGRTPRDAWLGRKGRRRRFEPRARRRGEASRKRRQGKRLQLAVSYVEGRRHLPIVELRRAA